MFEDAKEWLDKGKFEKTIGFLIIFVAVYALLWTIAEPLVSSEDIFGSGATRWWWKVQILVSIPISVAVFIWLLPKSILESFGFEIRDTKLNTAFTTATGNPKRQISTDGYYGEVLFFEGDFSTESSDCKVQPIAQKASSIKYTYFPIKSFVFYVHVYVLSSNQSTKRDVWIGFRTDITKPTGTKGQVEYSYPVISKPASSGWLYSNIPISKVVHQTFGLEGYRYHDLIEFRVRGEGKLQKIIVR